MAEAVSGAAIEILLQKLIAVSAEEIGLFRNFSKNSQKLKESIAMIRCFLEDAETKEVTEKSVRLWLTKLEAVAFDADYVFDELSYQLLRKKVQRGSQMKKKVRCFFFNYKSFAFRRRMAREIKAIEDQLNSINLEAERLDLRRGIESAPVCGAGTSASASRETDSLTKESVFIGRGNDASKIVEMVNKCPTEKVLSVIAIVGMGGLGKTTLAREVFHHHNIISRFESRIWVYVSENFVPETVFKNVFLSLTRRSVDGNREVILSELRQAIGDERYLLVLDDIWNEEREKWDNFITSLEAISPLKGNVILLTTRKENVASVAKANHTLRLGVLSEEDCWSIIKAKAFENESVPSEFETMGANIAKKCGGLPLAAKVVGSLLHGKSVGEWLSIEKKQLMDFTKDESNVSKILKLSFDNLSSPLLKKCFAYCSIMPKGRSMEKEEMIHLWMAEGLLQTDEEKDMEIMGETVFGILLRSSLLQIQKRDYWYEIEECFGMHDLVHDLASSILNSKFHEGAHQIRYMSTSSFTEESSLISEEEAKCLRALFFGGKISKSLFSNLTRLHVLILNDDKMQELPTEIGKLICLRLLNISNTIIKSLPDSIGDLYHLQTLRVTEEYGGASYFRELPHTFKFLSSLRHLYIPGNIALPPEIGKLTFLQTLPFFHVSNEEGCGITELGSLKNLRGKIEILNLEKVRDKEEAKNAGLSHKHAIRKLKLVWSYRSEDDDDDNDENVLEGLQPHRNLESLEIIRFKGESFPSWTLRMEVREDEWIRLDNLSEIKLWNCSACEEIPMMGHLPHLKSLYVNGLSKVKSIGSSFYGIKLNGADKDSSTIVFPALEKLVLIDMKILTSWTEVELSISCGAEVSVFPHLEYLKIVSCRELKSAPSHFPCLRELEIDGMGSGSPFASICGSKLTTLTKLNLRKVDGLVCLPYELLNSNRHLQELDIRYCDNLIRLVPCLGGGGASLKKLLIHGCSNFARFPEDLHKLNALEELRILNCGNLKSIAYRQSSSSQGLTSLSHLEFLCCSGLSNLPCEMVESCGPSLETLVLTGSKMLTNLAQVMSILPRMPRLKELRATCVPILDDVVVENENGCSTFSRIEKLQIGGGGGDYGPFKSIVDRIFSAMPCLVELMLQGNEEWDCDCDIPDHQQLQHLSTLHTLELYEFGIQVLPAWLERMPSLRYLKLWNCKKLRHVGSKKAMQALTKLAIFNCPLLKQNLEQKEEEEGSDDSEWSKVSHIPHIRVNFLPFSSPC